MIATLVMKDLMTATVMIVITDTDTVNAGDCAACDDSNSGWACSGEGVSGDGDRPS